MVERDRSVCCYWVDIEKAFDTIWHEGLLHKLLVFGFPVPLIKIVQSFLSGRHFYVSVFDGCSEMFSIPAGLPQGSSLSPCLYNLFTADLMVPSGADLAQFADDTGILCSGKNPERITRVLEKSFRAISKFYYKWRIRINDRKTGAVFFSRRRAARFLPRRGISLNGNMVSWSDYIKYLGVLLDRKLTFGENAKHTRVKALKCMRMVYPLINRKSKLSPRNKLLVFKSSLRPVLLYAAPVWGGCANSHFKGLQIAQNKCLRMVSNKPYCYPTLKLHEDTRVSFVKDSVKVQTDKFVSSCVFSENPLISSLFS